MGAKTETRNGKELFETMAVPRALRMMVVPTIISQIIVLVYNMADTFFVGRTNDPAMVAATSLILPVFNITLCLAGLAGVGGGTLVSRLLGQDRMDEARRVSSFSVALSVAVAAAFALGAGLFMEPLLRALGAGPATFEYARQYATCVIVAGGVPTVLSNVLSNLIRSTGRSREAGFGIALGGALNIALDPLFMFVIFPRGMEVLGVGVATLVSNCTACAYFFIVLARLPRPSVLSLAVWKGLPERESVAAVFAVGIPSAVATLLFDLDYVVIDRLMVGYSDVALAAVGIVLKVERLPLNVGIGICQGMMPLVAYNFAAKNHARMDGVVRLSRSLGLVVAAVSIALYEIFAPQLIRFFIGDVATVALATDFLRIRVLATPLMFLSFFTVYLFQAFGMGGKALFLGVMRWLAFNIPMLFALNALVGMYGIVWSQATADALTVALSLAVYHRFRPRAEQERSAVS